MTEFFEVVSGCLEGGFRRRILVEGGPGVPDALLFVAADDGGDEGGPFGFKPRFGRNRFRDVLLDRLMGGEVEVGKGGKLFRLERFVVGQKGVREFGAVLLRLASLISVHLGACLSGGFSLGCAAFCAAWVKPCD